MSGCLRHFAISILKDDNGRLLLDFCPRTWIRRETTDKIIYLLGWLVEVDTAGLLENLWCRLQFHALAYQLLLRHGFDIAISSDERIDGFERQLGSQVHQSVIDIFHICALRNRETLLHDDATCVDVMIEEECSNSRLLLAIDHSPVYWGSATILWQESSMNIEGAKLRHRPNHFRQHTESHYHLQVCLIRAKLLYKLRVLHLHWLQYRQTVLYSILLHLRRLQRILMSAHRLVWLSNHSHNIISAFYQALEGFHRKLRSSHENDS